MKNSERTRCVHCDVETKSKGVTVVTKIGDLKVFDRTHVAPECAECGAISLSAEQAKTSALNAVRIAFREEALTSAMVTSARRQFGLKQKEFAQVMETTPETVSRWERAGSLVPPHVRGQILGLALESLHPLTAPGAFAVTWQV